VELSPSGIEIADIALEFLAYKNSKVCLIGQALTARPALV